MVGGCGRIALSISRQAGAGTRARQTTIQLYDGLFPYLNVFKIEENVPS